MKNMRLSLNQTQKMLISPKLQHAIKLLQLSSIELAERIENELGENPFLEEEEEGEGEGEGIGGREGGNEGGNIFEDFGGRVYGGGLYREEEEDSRQKYLENAFKVEPSIYDYLLEQLRLTGGLREEEFRIGELIISSLCEDGYLRVSIEELANFLSCDNGEVEGVLKLIQSFEPLGVGGRDLREVLLIQFEQLEDKNELTRQIITKDLDLVKRNRYKEIVTKYMVGLKEVQESIKEISRLEPIPARQFSKNKVKYVVPDILVKKVDGGFSLSMNEKFLPRIRLSEVYKEILKLEKPKDKARDFFKEKFNEAKLLICSLEKRRNTIRLVVEELIKYQRSFFEKGIEYLKPLVLKDLADKIDLHESTISRVTSNKYIETPWGIFSLKYFFSGGVKKMSGDMQSSRSVKEIIKEIILNESIDKRLSDNKIVDILSRRGINIARRTVAKYRNSLHIEASFVRKRKNLIREN